MNKAEALEFIGLKEPYSVESVQNKYTERYNYFHMLYSNAPNKVIERIQQQNLEKLNQVKKILLDEIVAKKNEFNKKYSAPAPLPNPTSAQNNEKTEVAWLIVHTENKHTETYNLYEGINYIGRKKKDETANNIVIKDDQCISRTHAFIKCKNREGYFHFELYDGDGSKPSVNGVFLNGNPVRINMHCTLNENDTIQIGTTKMVFKQKKDGKSVTGELEDVMKTDFVRTIDIYK